LHTYIVHKPCPYGGDIKCNDTGVCIRSYDVCNGYANCNNGTDEENCSKCIIIIMHICIL